MYNKDSGYGQHHQSYPYLGGGQVHIVGKSGAAAVDILKDTFKVDPSGVNRYFATIDKAFDACVANRGDVIFVAPDHTENISAATSLVFDKAGVSVIGLGQGLNIPTLTFTATAGSIEMDAANCRFENFRLTSSITAVVVGINVDASGCTLSNLRFDWDETGDDFITMIDVDAVNDITIENCTFIAEDAAGCNEAIRLDDTDNTTIRNCQLYGDFTDAAIIGEGAVGTNLLIHNNVIYNSDTTAGLTVDLNVAFTGICSNNFIGTLYAADPETAFDPGSLLCIENYVANAIDESGTIVPTLLST